MIEVAAATAVLIIFGAIVSAALVYAGGAAARRRTRELTAQRDHLLNVVNRVEAMANSYKDVEPGSAAIAAYLASENTKGLY